MLRIPLSINQTGNGDPPPKDPKRQQVPVEKDPVDAPAEPK
jgi:hypothetical protein